MIVYLRTRVSVKKCIKLRYHRFKKVYFIGTKVKSIEKYFKQRTVVERVNIYLKEFYQLNNVHYHTEKPAKVHLGVVALVYNCFQLIADYIQAKLIQQKAL